MSLPIAMAPFLVEVSKSGSNMKTLRDTHFIELDIPAWIGLNGSSWVVTIRAVVLQPSIKPFEKEHDVGLRGVGCGGL